MSTKNIIRIGRVIRLIKKSSRSAEKAIKKKRIIPIPKKVVDANLFEALVKERNSFIAKRSKLSSVPGKVKLDKLFKR